MTKEIAAAAPCNNGADCARVARNGAIVARASDRDARSSVRRKEVVLASYHSSKIAHKQGFKLWDYVIVMEKKTAPVKVIRPTWFSDSAEKTRSSGGNFLELI